MGAEYALFKNPNPNKEEDNPTLHARVVGGIVIDTEHIIDELREASSFSSGDIRSGFGRYRTFQCFAFLFEKGNKSERNPGRRYSFQIG